MKIIQESEGINPRHTIEFDEFERNDYVGRFLDVFRSGLSEQEMCEQAYQIHLEICTNADLYIAVFDKLGWNEKEALRIYVAHRGCLPDNYHRPRARRAE